MVLNPHSRQQSPWLWRLLRVGRKGSRRCRLSILLHDSTGCIEHEMDEDRHKMPLSVLLKNQVVTTEHQGGGLHESLLHPAEWRKRTPEAYLPAAQKQAKRETGK
jgi:hypothetical protein